MSDTRPIVSMRGISKTFGQVKALTEVDLEIFPAELVGIVGHNGAGKSTLMGILRGTVARDEGRFRVDTSEVPGDYDVRQARGLGIRSVFQELSLCPTLTVAENTRLSHRGLTGWGWARTARRVIAQALDTIFPAHGIPLDATVDTLSASARQMVEIARAFSVLSIPPRLVILDEPTSALDAQAAHQFLDYIGRARADGLSCLLISHRLKEIVDHTDRVVVMRDGHVVEERRSASLSPEQLVEAMGVMAQASEEAPARSRAGSGGRIGAPAGDLGAVLVQEGAGRGTGVAFTARAGEIVGLAGLDGHGQKQQLQAIFRGATAPADARLTVDAKVAYVSGDRRAEGIFALWSIGNNLTISLIRRIARFGFVSAKDEEAAAREWRSRVGIKTPGPACPDPLSQRGQPAKGPHRPGFGEGCADRPPRRSDAWCRCEQQARNVRIHP